MSLFDEATTQLGEVVPDVTARNVGAPAIEPPAATATAMPPWLVESPAFKADTDNVRRLGMAFFGRKEPTPIRRSDTWKAEKRLVTMDDFAKHLSGRWALGAYLLDDHDTTGAVIADIDAKGELKESVLAGDPDAVLDLACWARCVGQVMSVVFASSVHVTLTGGKGAHVIHVLPQRAPAAILRRQMQWMCFDLGLKRDGLEWKNPTGDVAVDTFPRQDATDGGLGNLIRLPNGVDPATGRRALVVVDDPTRMQAQVCEPLYRVDPVGGSEAARRELQAIIDTGRQLDWLEGYLLAKYEPGLRERCEELLALGIPQMANAVGQVLHQWGWGTGSWESMTCRGLLADLEELATAL